MKLICCVTKDYLNLGRDGCDARWRPCFARMLAFGRSTSTRRRTRVVTGAGAGWQCKQFETRDCVRLCPRSPDANRRSKLECPSPSVTYLRRESDSVESNTASMFDISRDIRIGDMDKANLVCLDRGHIASRLDCVTQMRFALKLSSVTTLTAVRTTSKTLVPHSTWYR